MRQRHRSTIRMSHRGATVALLAALAAACAEPTAPAALVGDYPLAAVGGDAPPQPVGSIAGCSVTVVDGTLNFRQSWPPSGSGDWSGLGWTQVRDCRDVGGDSTQSPVLYLGTFLVDGDGLTFVTQLSQADTLRWQGRVDGRFIAVTVLDSIRPDVVPAPIALRFGPQQPMP
ncbi:MAG: hypothetical protein OER21_16970 [Gemmatimonadota bacterium]|nr:hypothetical protein [Gemmatimonadota bacterium]